MDWIFENLQILFVIAAAVAYWLNNLRQAKEEAEHERDEKPVDIDEVFGPDFDFNSPPPRRDVPPHTEVFLPPPVSAPPPLPHVEAPRGRRDFPAGTPTPPRSASPHAEPAMDAIGSELERQRNLDERIRSLRKSREQRHSGAAATQRAVVARRDARKGVTDAIAPTSLDGIRDRLRSPREARRAIVLREILDKPVGMR